MLLVAVLGIGNVAAQDAPTRWTMLHVQGQIGQADCHLVTLPDGRHVLIDAGEAGDAPGSVVSQLQRHGVNHLALTVVSHFHGDHYGRLIDVLNAGIGMDKVIVNVPERRVADRERPWGCNYDDVIATLATLRDRGVPYETPQAGDRLIESVLSDGSVAGIEVICAYDGVNTPIGETDVNDTSIIVRLYHGTTRVLFTGDLNHALGSFLAGSGADIRADILKAPHHGTEGCAPNEFFERVDPSAVLVPSPTALWLSQRSSRTRNFFGDRGVPTLVNGMHGNVTVWLRSGSYRIQTEIRDFNTEVSLPPSVILPPASATVSAGTRLTLSVTVSGSPMPTIQWSKDGAIIDGATGPTLTFSNAHSNDSGSYFAIATNPHGIAESLPAQVTITDQPLPTPTTALVNLSARGWVGSGDSTMVAGFVIGGQGSKGLLARAVGPSLTALGVDRALPNPRLTLTTGAGRVVAQNNDWGTGNLCGELTSAAERTGAFPLEPGSLDSAVLLNLPPGSYTLLAHSSNHESGVALVELYDLEPVGSAYLVNLSARSWVDSGDSPLIAGFVLQGSGDSRTLCRAVGPSLGQFGLFEFLRAPSLAIHTATYATSISDFTDHSRATGEEVTLATTSSGAFGLLSGERDIATVLRLPPGLRTAIVSGADDTSGIALVELYLLP